MSSETAMLRSRGALAAALGAFALASCTPLRAFDTLVPKDPDSIVVVRNAAFGSDPRQRLDVYRPRAIGTAALPIIIFFYGGSWNSGSKSDYSFVGRALAARGFLVVLPDYRLVPGVRFPSFLEDNAMAVRWVRAHGAALGGDSARLILAGHSAGAYNAAMLALDPLWLGSDRQWVCGLVGLAGPYDFSTSSGPVVRATFAGVSKPAATQPINFVAAGDPPAFLATGENDDVVRPANSDSLAARLISAGVRVERRTYPGVGHAGLLTAIARPLRGRATVLPEMAAFARAAAENCPVRNGRE